MTSTMKAVEIKRLEGLRGDARLFRLSEPISYGDGNRGSTNYVIVSASVVPFSGPETYIFPANEEGEVISWGEMDGSYRGGLSHKEAIRNAGWNT